MSPSHEPTAQIGVTGLAVMGSNIARNFARHGYTVALHNRSIAKTDALLAQHGSDGNFVRSETIAEFLAALQRPRRVLIMVKAGEATDAVINELADAMEPGDIIIDGGNALYTDTIRREKAIRDRGLHFGETVLPVAIHIDRRRLRESGQRQKQGSGDQQGSGHCRLHGRFDTPHLGIFCAEYQCLPITCPRPLAPAARSGQAGRSQPRIAS